MIDARCAGRSLLGKQWKFGEHTTSVSASSFRGTRRMQFSLNGSSVRVVLFPKENAQDCSHDQNGGETGDLDDFHDHDTVLTRAGIESAAEQQEFIDRRTD